MNEPGLRITAHFGERDRHRGRFQADRVVALFEAHRLRASVLMRGVEGFGAKHHLRTDRLLTPSESLPVVAVGVDARDRVETLAADLCDMGLEGLVTTEQLELAAPGEIPEIDGQRDFEAKLTLHLGRGLRAGGMPAHEAVVALLRERGIDGASVILGVDGTLHGRRQRARFFARNALVPAIVISIGSADAIAATLPELGRVAQDAVVTIERVRVLKRDGHDLASGDWSDGPRPNVAHKLTLYSSEQAHFDGRPVHVEAVRRLRGEGAAGATTLRGVWGYDGRHGPHGDTFWGLRRRVPTLTTVIDTPERAQRWLEVLDQITPQRGLITGEPVSVPTALGRA